MFRVWDPTSKVLGVFRVLLFRFNGRPNFLAAEFPLTSFLIVRSSNSVLKSYSKIYHRYFIILMVTRKLRAPSRRARSGGNYRSEVFILCALHHSRIPRLPANLDILSIILDFLLLHAAIAWLLAIACCSVFMYCLLYRLGHSNWDSILSL